MIRSHSKITRRRAFTLVELLAVIGIIAVMAAVIGGAMGGGNGAASLGSSQRIASGIFQSAHSVAVLKQTDTRVLIYSESGGTTDTARSLRFMQVVYKDPDNANRWIAANTGTYLPQGVYFVPKASDIGDFLATQAEAGFEPNGLNANTYSSDYGSGTVNVYANENATSGNNFPAYYYEFDSNGLSEQPGAKVTFAAGTVAAPSEAAPKLAFENEFAVTGFYLRRLGNTSLADYDSLSTVPTNN